MAPGQVVVTDNANEHLVLPLTVTRTVPLAATRPVVSTLGPVAATSAVLPSFPTTERDGQPKDVDVAIDMPAATENVRLGLLRFSDEEKVVVFAVGLGVAVWVGVTVELGLSLGVGGAVAEGDGEGLCVGDGEDVVAPASAA